MLYQRKDLASGSNVGEPGPLPPELVGLADHSLADLSWADPALGYSGAGFVPVSARIVTTREFMRRLTPGEQVAIEAASSSDAQIRVLMRLLYADMTVNLDAPDTVAALTYLVGAGLLAAERPDAIRA